MTLDDLEGAAREILEVRKGDIEDGSLEGQHWMLAVMRCARELLRRQRTWQTRTSHRGDV